MEEYAAKMQAKSEAELRQYVSRYAEYRDDAVLAALAELRRRGLPAPEEAALRPALEAAVAQQAETAAATRSQPAAATEDGPELYSPGTIVLFSVLFSMLGGGILLGINLRRLRRTGALVRLAVFVVACFAGELFALHWAVKQFGQNLLLLAVLPKAFDVLALVAYLTWFWPRYVGPQPYRSRGWLLPFMLFFAFQLVLVKIASPMLNGNGLPGFPPAAVPTAPAKRL